MSPSPQVCFQSLPALLGGSTVYRPDQRLLDRANRTTEDLIGILPETLCDSIRSLAVARVERREHERFSVGRQRFLFVSTSTLFGPPCHFVEFLARAGFAQVSDSCHVSAPDPIYYLSNSGETLGFCFGVLFEKAGRMQPVNVGFKWRGRRKAETWLLDDNRHPHHRRCPQKGRRGSPCGTSIRGSASPRQVGTCHWRSPSSQFRAQPFTGNGRFSTISFPALMVLLHPFVDQIRKKFDAKQA